jgi:CRISPR/Cas system-associated exonuclease Cas4 (RecB family)
MADHGIQPQKWDADTLESAMPVVEPELQPTKAKVTGRAPVFTESALSTYLRCPRQYYYRHVENLAAAAPKSAYQKLHAVVWQTLAWMRASWASGEIAELSDILAHLDELWADRGPVGAPNEPIYRERAHRMVANAFEIGTRGMRILDRLPLETELSGARVKVYSDAAFETENRDSLMLVRYKTGRRAKDDHTDKNLALLRKAAEATGKSVEIELQYLLSGDVVPVPPSVRYEPARVEKYVAAVQGILASDFKPTPGRECRSCPFMLICER